jgi:hypothetical protein
MADLTSRPYQTADPQQHCERCIFNSGEHADFCGALNRQQDLQRQLEDLHRQYERWRRNLTSRARRAFVYETDAQETSNASQG